MEKRREKESKRSFVEKSSIKYPNTSSRLLASALQLTPVENTKMPCESGRSTEEKAAWDESVKEISEAVSFSTMRWTKTSRFVEKREDE